MREIRAKGRGKTFFRSAEACRRQITEGEVYLIRRHGSWFRPEAAGYTGDLAEAGLFDAANARSYVDCEGVSVIRLADARYLARQYLQALEARAEALRRIIQGAPLNTVIERDCDTCEHEDARGRCVAPSMGDCLPQDGRPLWEKARGAESQRCSLGVGCDEAGVCYAAAHGQPDQCGWPSA